MCCTELLYFNEKVKQADFHMSMAKVPKLFTLKGLYYEASMECFFPLSLMIRHGSAN